jgi:6-phosphogluconolactonase/glucosamine-6-phosphate isomerase/deaminase
MKIVEGTPSDAVSAIAGRISDELRSGKRVLWLVSGGSNIQLEVDVMNQLQESGTVRLSGLAILPVDERYGEPGHADSNTAQLRNAGFDPGTAVWVDVLTHNVPFDQTMSFYNDVASTAFANASVVIAQFGMGGDGHIAGMLPDSPGVSAEPVVVIGYEWSDYTRMTLSADILRGVQVAYVPAFGKSKEKALDRFRANTEPFEKLPAKLLYELPEVFIYTDQLKTEEK